MTKFTQAQREEIERIKGEYYCGTRLAVKIYETARKWREFADEVNEVLRSEGVAEIGWQVACRVKKLLPFIDFRGTRESYFDETGEWGDPRHVALVCKGLLEEDEDSRHYLFKLGAAATNEITLTGIDAALCTPSGYEHAGVPRHMANWAYDTVYFRAREEDTLHCPDVQRTFLVRTAMAAGVDSLEGLTDFLKLRYAQSQRQGKWEPLLMKDLRRDFEELDREVTDAASYGLGLLARSDLRGWLRKYLGA